MNQTIRIKSAQKQLIVIETIRKEVLRALLIFLLVSITFLFLRTVLKLMGANSESVFVGFVYLVSGIFLLPFYGIFPQFEDPVPGQSGVDMPAFVAIFCYLILIPLAMGVVQIGAKIFKTGEQTNKTVEERQTVDTKVVDKALE